MATVNFNLPSPYESELADIARRQKMAELMQQQAFQPAETFSYNGIQARTSPLTGIAKALQGYTSMKMQKDLINEQKALGEKAREQSMQEGTQFFNALRGAPANEGTAGVPEQKYTPSPFDIEDNPQLLTNLNPQQQAAVNMKQMPELTVPEQKGLPPQAAKGPDYARALELASRSQFNPMVQSAGGAILANMMKAPESAFGKVDAKDYTPESVRAFASGGGKDYSVLVPVRKQEFIESTDPNTGRTVKIPVNPYAPPEKGIVQPMSGFIGELQNLGLLTPSMMQNPQVQNLLSGYFGKQTGQITPVELQRIQVDLARLRDQQVRTQAETGMSAGVPSAPQPFSLFGQPPVNAPTVMNAPNVTRGIAPAPMETPTVASAVQQGIGLPVDLSRTGLPLKSQREIQTKLLTEQLGSENKKTASMAGLGDALKQAEQILTSKKSPPTQSGIGTAIDTAAAVFGNTPAGAAQADKLKTIAANIILKMPRMEGPQSDRDTLLYREMAGDIGNSSLPIPRRLAALEAVRSLNERYVGKQTSEPSVGSADQQALEWANTNPTDPRAAAIRKRLGQ